MKICVIKNVGLADVLEFKQVDIPTNIGENDLLIDHTAIGINFDDILYRKGVYELPKPFIDMPEISLGFEGVGIVKKKGSMVKNIEVGEKVAYAISPFGSYAQSRILDYRYSFKISEDVDDFTMAALARKGIAAQYLLFKIFQGKKGDWILIHNIAGGLGHIMAKLAKFSGFKVIGTISNESKRAFASSTGADLIINRENEDMVSKVLDITENIGVSALYDGIGKEYFDKSLNCIRYNGIYISIGYSSGLIPNLSILTLKEKNIFFIAPTLELYTKNRHEMLLMSLELMEFIKNGVISPTITRYGFDGIKQAHIDLESKQNKGCIVIAPY